MSGWTEEHKLMLEDCENRLLRLNDWEVEFIESMRGWLDEDVPMTEKQEKTLDEVWAKATETG